MRGGGATSVHHIKATVEWSTYIDITSGKGREGGPQVTCPTTWDDVTTSLMSGLPAWLWPGMAWMVSWETGVQDGVH